MINSARATKKSCRQIKNSKKTSCNSKFENDANFSIKSSGLLENQHINCFACWLINDLYSASYRNQLIDLLRKSIDWFLDDC